MISRGTSVMTWSSNNWFRPWVCRANSPRRRWPLRIQRENQEFSAQSVFFSPSNYLSAVTVTPDAVAQYYTNYLAAYRLPDRVQVSYRLSWFCPSLSSYLLASGARAERSSSAPALPAVACRPPGRRASPRLPEKARPSGGRQTPGATRWSAVEAAELPPRFDRDRDVAADGILQRCR